MARIPAQIEMARWIFDMGGKVKEKTFFEVGTGHCPVVPIGFFLCGAEQVVTVDLNRRLDLGILEKSLVLMAENRDAICGYYDVVANPQISPQRNRLSISQGKQIAQIVERMDLIDRLKEMPEKFLSEANIQYLAPADAADIGLPDASVDYHISTTVFEHIPGVDIERILKEAKRILKEDGVAIHFIDLSDHFQHQDNSITSINFLRYSEKEWDKIAGNEFAYCNRLRVSDYLALFEDLGFDVDRHEIDVDQESMDHLQKKGFPLDQKFVSYTPEDICSTLLRVLLSRRVD
ncbi:MAG: methyltransferase domain-containing protein [Acidobacteriota bacterium]|nr:methyltransferase domain-containing protein [Acidobacteriota bacterium]